MYKYIHTCIYIHIYMSAHIHTYTYIHTRIQNVHMNARKARLKRQRGSDCAGSPTWHQKALPFSLSASQQRAVQTTSAYLHWCAADPPSSLSTPAPSLAVAPRNEVIFLPFWRGFLHLLLLKIRMILQCRQTTTNDFLCLPDMLLGLLFKLDPCIVSP